MSYVTVSSDGKYLISENKDKYVCIWNYESGSLVKIEKIPDDPQIPIEIAPEMRYLINFGQDNKI